MDTILFSSQNLRIGAFRCPPSQANFSNTGPINGYMLVFPRTSVLITHVDCKPVIADPSVVMFYNHQQEYQRGLLSERGDQCEWFSFAPSIIREAVAFHEPHVAACSERLFAFTHAPSDSHCYMAQRLITHQLTSDVMPDGLQVEETMFSILATVLDQAYQVWNATNAAMHQRTTTARELTHAVKATLAVAFRERLTLDDLAHILHVSPYYLCRCFQCCTGTTIHQYLTQLRLRTALEFIAESDADLATLGVELGFTSHSHFTHAFRTHFGCVPSRLRRALSAYRMRELHKILIA